MKKFILSAAATLFASSLIAAESTPAETVAKAAKALGDKSGYSWTSTVVVPESARFKPGPTEGKTEKDGPTLVSMSFGPGTTEFVIKGDKSAVKTRDDGWQSLAELDNAEGPGRFFGMMVKNFKAPATQAAELAASAKELKSDDDAIVGVLSEDEAKSQLTFRRGGGDGPSVSDAKGSVKFWVKDGALSKYEIKVTGKMDFNGNSMDMDRATTVAIKDVGSTKVTVPDDAKKKLE
jgi:hypothetical protein